MDFSLLGHNAVQSAESQNTFQMSMSPPSSGSKNKPSVAYIPEDGIRHKLVQHILAVVKTNPSLVIFGFRPLNEQPSLLISA
jgi:hypothetical protein